MLNPSNEVAQLIEVEVPLALSYAHLAHDFEELEGSRTFARLIKALQEAGVERPQVVVLEVAPLVAQDSPINEPELCPHFTGLFIHRRAGQDHAALAGVT